MSTTLFILHNSDNRLFSVAISSVVKIVNPEALHCDLYRLTHGYFGKKETWSQFMKELSEMNINVRTLYRDDLQQWPLHFKESPSIYCLSEGRLRLVQGAAELKRMRNCKELVESVRKALLDTSNSESRTAASRIH